MIEFGQNIANGTELSADICIVGAGPAGITAAWYLQEAGLKVILLEGSRDVENQGINENKWLYNGSVSGQLLHNEPSFLTLREQYQNTTSPSERERVYGGTGVHWGGQSRPLDAIVFEGRKNFPAWPISRDDLDPYYEKYCKLMQLHGDYVGPNGEVGHNFSAAFWAETLGERVPDLEHFDVAMYQFPLTELIRFQSRKFPDANGKTIGESNARVIRNASLLEIEHQGNSVTGLKVASMTADTTNPQPATHFTVKANAYVLACGAVANARQLLLSNLGNGSDQLGRYFMGQPFSLGLPVTVNADSYLDADEISMVSYQGNQQQFGINMVAGKFQPKAKTLSDNGVGSMWFNHGGSIVYFELSPDRLNQVALAKTNDPVFGQPQTHLNWSPNLEDMSTYETLTNIFFESVVKRAKTHRPHEPINFVKPHWKDIMNSLIINGHHIGTTRMSAKPVDGVVDGDLKLHEADNFFVAGSSVFTTGGLSNPTMTIVALSMRLADHLKSNMS